MYIPLAYRTWCNCWYCTSIRNRIYSQGRTLGYCNKVCLDPSIHAPLKLFPTPFMCSRLCSSNKCNTAPQPQTGTGPLFTFLHALSCAQTYNTSIHTILADIAWIWQRCIQYMHIHTNTSWWTCRCRFTYRYIQTHAYTYRYIIIHSDMNSPPDTYMICT